TSINILCDLLAASAVIFQQSPPQIVDKNQEIQINCKHNDSSLLIMLWYQQRKENTSMTLIGSGYYQQSQSYEGEFEKQFTVARSSTVEGTLTIKNTDVSHSAVYFCAASTQ
uniref:Ig-like domain-containing protein n=1 Tax=Pundamilia nyererei TaxID=303518 RepID=A0A3B4FY44_9CICH